MEERISKRKLEFIDHIKESDDNTFVKKVFNEQLKKEWPGLIQECDNLCEDLELPKVSKNKLSKRDINNALQEKTRSVLIEKMKTSTKMEDKVEEAFQRKEYFDNKVISEVRAMFAARSGMFNSSNAR